MLKEIFVGFSFPPYWFSFQRKEAKNYNYRVFLILLIADSGEKFYFIKDCVSGQSWLLHFGCSQADQWGGDITNCSRWKTY
jgi:hypothetical protein